MVAPDACKTLHRRELTGPQPAAGEASEAAALTAAAAAAPITRHPATGLQMPHRGGGAAGSGRCRGAPVRLCHAAPGGTWRHRSCGHMIAAGGAAAALQACSAGRSRVMGTGLLLSPP